MKKTVLCTILFVASWVQCVAQIDRVVQNRPYADLRPLHFGVLLGTHVQDVELNNIGVQHLTHEDESASERLITVDQNRWDAGLTVGVLAEMRLSKYFQFRIAPAMYFGNRHLTFRDYSMLDKKGMPTEQQQDMKNAYISSALDIIFAAPRFNNHRPYLITGVNPMINLNGKNDQFVALKRYDVFAEIGVGCDFYLQYFKLRPELKFMFGLTNSYDKNHVKGTVSYTHLTLPTNREV